MGWLVSCPVGGCLRGASLDAVEWVLGVDALESRVGVGASLRPSRGFESPRGYFVLCSGVCYFLVLLSGFLVWFLLDFWSQVLVFELVRWLNDVGLEQGVP